MRKPKNGGFVRELFPPHPGLFFDEVGPSSRKLKRAFEGVHAHLPYLKQVEMRAATRILSAKRRDQICDTYWREKWDNTRPTLVQTKPYAARILKPLEQVIKEFEASPLFVRNALYALLSTDWGFASHDVDTFLKDLRASCYEVSYAEGDVGRKRPVHVDNLVSEFASVWTQLTGRAVPKTIASTGSGEFTSPAAQFILVLAGSVDEDLDFTVIRTALKRRGAAPVQD